jgi:hypothetical protein
MSDPLEPFVAPEMPGPRTFEASSAKESPFAEPLDEEELVKNLMLDKPLKLTIPSFLDQVGYEYGFATTRPGGLAKWESKGWRKVDNIRVRDTFAHLHGGKDENGKEYGVVLMARPKSVAKFARRRSQQLYLQQQRDMHPKNKTLDIDSEYARVEDNRDVTKYNRSGFGAPQNFVATDARNGPINSAREHMRWNPQTNTFEPNPENPGGVTTGLKV